MSFSFVLMVSVVLSRGTNFPSSFARLRLNQFDSYYITFYGWAVKMLRKSNRKHDYSRSNAMMRASFLCLVVFLMVRLYPSSDVKSVVKLDVVVGHPKPKKEG